MLNPASIDDLIGRWHPYPFHGDSAGELAAQIKLDQAWRALRDELPGLVARIDSGDVQAESVVDVVIDATLRAMRNPEGYVEGSESVDDYSESWKTDPASQSNDMFFTRAELRRLSPRASGAAAFTIRPGR